VSSERGLTLPRTSHRSPRTVTFTVVKIYTRTGDGGETALFGGGRVPKDHLRVAAYGDVDELNSALGAAMACVPGEFEAPLLESIQRDLFSIGGQLASPNPDKVAKALAKAEIPESRVRDLESAIDRAETELAPLGAFVLPGGTPKAAALHVARTVCRRAERIASALAREESIGEFVLRYLNRLSDALFVMARYENKQRSGLETLWDERA